MRYTTLNNGLKMPVIGLGTWKSKPGEVYQAVIWALKAGYRQIDCAQIYGNEKEIGQALQDAFKDGLVKREELWVTSKLWNNAHAAADVLPALKKTLADLQLEYLDLYLIHWPVVQKKEVIFPSGAEDMLPLEEVPLSETWREMEKAVKAGLVRSIGLSNCGEKRIGGVLAACSLKPAVLQIENHPFLQQKELIAFAKAGDCGDGLFAARVAGSEQQAAGRAAFVTASGYSRHCRKIAGFAGAGSDCLGGQPRGYCYSEVG